MLLDMSVLPWEDITISVDDQQARWEQEWSWKDQGYGDDERKEKWMMLLAEQKAQADYLQADLNREIEEKMAGWKNLFIYLDFFFIDFFYRGEKSHRRAKGNRREKNVGREKSHRGQTRRTKVAGITPIHPLLDIPTPF